jgi:hypothetical protein
VYIVRIDLACTRPQVTEGGGVSALIEEIRSGH